MLKELILKFGYRTIQATCKEKGWKLPTSQEILDSDQEFNRDVVWVSDKVLNPDDVKTHAYIYVISEGRLVLCNKNFMQHSIVKGK